MRLIDADAVETSYSDPEVKESLDLAPTINAIVIPEGATRRDLYSAISTVQNAILHAIPGNPEEVEDWWNAPCGNVQELEKQEQSKKTRQIYDETIRPAVDAYYKTEEQES
jgi:hypothetical protein